MAVLEIQGNFEDEKQTSNDRFGKVEAAITAISNEIPKLTENWSDEKSATYIGALQSFVDEVKPKVTTAKTEAESTFVSLDNILKIYSE